MRRIRSTFTVVLFVLYIIAGFGMAGPAQSPAVPDAVIDLRTVDGAAMVQGQWRYAEAQIVEVDHHSPGPDLKPTGAANRTHDVMPHAGAADFDDSQWERIGADTLENRRGSGRLSFGWYRLTVTVPERVGSFQTNGSTLYFEIVMDDYAEVWVDGKLPTVLGQRGGGMVAGWNAPNRILLARQARPGQKIQIAVFAANGPLSEPPGNYIWVRSATLDFYKADRAAVGTPVKTEILRLDPAMDDIISPGSTIEKLADGFGFTEGPVWVNSEDGGYLLFSDPNQNVIHRWTPDGEVSIFRTKSGYAGANMGAYHQPGSNGLTLDREGRLTINEHGNRRVTRLEKNGTITVLTDRFEGKRLNSPNDLVYKSDGSLYFTDPPFGLPKVYDDPAKELAYCGVFRWKDGTLTLLSTDLKGPNGIAFSPDEKYLYVTNWDEKKKIVMRYDVAADGTLGNGAVFYDMTAAPGEEALDGMKVDDRGDLFVSGPGGVWVISPQGKQLGMIVGPELPANFAWGDSDGRTLYLCARTGLYRVRLNVAGAKLLGSK